MDESANNLKRPDPTLPTGLTIRARGESIEAVVSKAIEVRLLVTSFGLELAEGKLYQGERMTLESSGEAVESYYILSGQLRCNLPTGPRLLGAGDYLVTEALSEATTLSAQTEVRFLYVTSEPLFHEISEIHNDLMRLAVEVELKDGYTADHCYRLQVLAYATGQELGLSQRRLNVLDHGAYLHDIGKLKVPVAILQKAGPLTPDEWDIIKQHPRYGREMLETTSLRAAGLIVEQHHERLDGSGYPYGLAGDEILTEAAIVAVVDTFDAMTSDRPYQRARSNEEAFAELQRYAGQHYASEVVEAFLAASKKIE